ncbi:unnamed protein product [Rhizophagus irregularis]|nr:unnamed protein product [Rhizophagus irregularis]
MFTKGEDVENQLGKALYQDDHYKECFPHNRATATTTTTDLHQGYPFQMHKASRIIETWKKRHIMKISTSISFANQKGNDHY